jgi:hypothetical protein
MANLDEAPSFRQLALQMWARCAEAVELASGTDSQTRPIDGDVLIIDLAARTVRWPGAQV